MGRGMTESEWRLFRQLQAVSLDRFCQRVLTEVGELAADAAKTNHERYLEVFRLLKRRDKELAAAFDDPRRSVALQQLACIQSHGLLTAEEFARFRPETRASVQAVLGD